MEKKVQGFTAVIERDKTTGFYVGEVVELPGCFTQGKSIEEVIKRLEELIPVFVDELGVTSEFVAIQRIPLKV